ncbi:unnamed protein product [Miscanthus lutarioriparius]|uniref:F-box domain-containing protein n=1 Tax=Miscanthus lutarioriparius TaxID=422564 RepID=A0A811SH03_9POAL|nr:unnamed protein product [Miscanthus lutarioriparius]
MADSPPPPPPPPAPTTITALSDDLLLEIFLRLPSFTSLARAAFACRAFLHAVRSSPAFRRRFRELRARPLLALFLLPYMRAIVPAATGTPTSSTKPPTKAPATARPSRVVCVHRESAWAWARVAVFSSHTMEWQLVLPPEMDTGGALDDTTGSVVNGIVCWVHKGKGCILALNTVTFQFSRMDLPPPLKVPSSRLQLGHTKDGEFCVVSVLQCMLSVWLWAADGDGVERFMPHKTFSLRANVSEVINEADVHIRPMAVINGFVYLSLTVAPFGDPRAPQLFVSFCLETAKVNLLHKESKRIFCPVDPYIKVSWPSSLIHCKVSLCLCI